MAQRLLDVAVRGAEFVIRQRVFRAQPGSHANDAVEELMSHLEEIALNLWWKKVPLPREEKIQDMSLRNQLNMMLRDQI